MPEIKKVPGTSDVKLYDNSDGCVRDVVAGRLDFALLDGPLVDYLILKNANWGLKQVPLNGWIRPSRSSPASSTP